MNQLLENEKVEETLWHINLDSNMFLNFFTVIQLFIMGSPFEVYFRFHVIVFMTVNCCMCLTMAYRHKILTRAALRSM